MDLAEGVLAGSRLALARLLTQVENGTPDGRQALEALFAHTGSAKLVGVTGPPGTGKSSLVNRLTLHFRRSEPPSQVAIVAVDPTSPFTGGAILGDRVRMRDLHGDPGVFIRSMASRGSLGGLAAATSGVVQALDAAGFDLILVETVGAGQAEVDIARLAHTVLVVEAPGLGDDIQAIKAGILEIADILVINKADLPGVEATERALLSMIQLAHPAPRVFQNQKEHHHLQAELTESGRAGRLWITPIQRTVATDGQGVADLAVKISEHQRFLLETGGWEQREHDRLHSELDGLLREALVQRWRSSVQESRYRDVLGQVIERQISPWQAVEKLLSAE